MIESLGPYPQMAPSGFEWLGDVPDHWEMLRLKSLVDQKSEQTPVQQADTLYVALEHVESWTGRAKAGRAEAVHGLLKRFEPGDVLFGKLRPYLAKVTRPKLHGLCVGEFLVFRTRSRISAAFLEHVLRSKPTIEWIDSSAFGARMPRADWRFIGSMKIAVPPMAEQTAIARFLDHADRRIQRYICAKEKVIALLEEQKRALVHQAVTGQINVRTGQPYSAYKPSSVAYVSTIPKQWQVRKLGKVATVFNGSTPSRSQAAYWTGGEIPWLNSSKVNDEFVVEPSDHVTRRALEECSISLVPSGAVIVGLVGQGRTRGMAALLQISTTINQNLAAIVPTRSLEGAFLHRFLNAHYEHIREMGRGGNQEALNCDVVARFRVTVPPLSEQRVIACYLEDALSTFASALSRARKQIALCLEFRTRLIADVVTGKLDVQEVVATLPKVDPLADDDEGHDSLYAGNTLAFDQENQPVEVAG